MARRMGEGGVWRSGLLSLFAAVMLGLAVLAGGVALAPRVASAQSKIDINTADAKQLETLPGIGKTTAERIIEHRTTNGPFKSVKDLLKVKGIGEKTLAKFEDQVTVGGGGAVAGGGDPEDAGLGKKVVVAKPESGGGGGRFKDDGGPIDLTKPPGKGAGSKPTAAAPGDSGTPTPTPTPGGMININTADAKQLETLPGIGKTTAERIIEHRKANGPFKSVKDLLKVKGIGEKTLAKFEGQIVAQ